VQQLQMLQYTVYKRFKVLLHFEDAEYYRDVQRVLNRIEMALGKVVVMLYVIDILYYTIFDGNWGIGIVKWENFLFHGYSTTFGGMASKGLWVISYQGTRNVEAGYKPSYTTENLIGYTACSHWAFLER
jgi:hypothetical protein